MRQKTWVGDPLGGRIQEGDVAPHQAFFNLRGLLAAQSGVQKLGTHPRLVQGADLVVHEGNQRADDNRDALPRLLTRNRRNLVAKRLAAASGHQNQRIAARHHVLDDGLLGPTEGAVAKDFLKNEVNGQNEFTIN